MGDVGVVTEGTTLLIIAQVSSGYQNISYAQVLQIQVHVPSC